MKALKGAGPVLAVLLVLAWGSALASAQPMMAGLGTLGGGWSEANGINNSGQVVGASHLDPTTAHAGLWFK